MAEEYSNLQGFGVAASCPFCSCWAQSEGFEGPGGVPGGSWGRSVPSDRPPVKEP
jgi:hypothetical protein